MTAKEVRALRKKLGLTQDWFARVLMVTQQSVNRWEQGHTAPTGLSEVLLRLVASVLTKHPVETVLTVLRRHDSNETELVRTLVKMEGGDAVSGATSGEDTHS